MENKQEVIQGLDLMDLVGFVGRKNKKFQAIMLQDIEEVMQNKTEYAFVRKIILDGFNNYTRSVLRVIFGDSFEYPENDKRLPVSEINRPSK